MAFILGVDLGKRQDYSALVGLEYTRIDGRRQYWARGFNRWALDTNYTDACRDLVTATQKMVENFNAVYLAFDATGVGADPVDMIREKIPQAIEIWITGGRQPRDIYPEEGRLGWTVPRELLLSAPELLLEQGRLKIASRHKLAENLKEELLAFGEDNRRGSDSDSEDELLWRESGEHDDLVLALSIGCWTAQQIPLPDEQVPDRIDWASPELEKVL